MHFEKRHPLSLNELLIAPIVFRANLPELSNQPLASAAGMRDLAEFGGFSPGAIRTAMSRLRASGMVETQEDVTGVARYRLGRMSSSIARAVTSRPARPLGFLLVVFSFAAQDARERQVVREALKLHGFQKLAQNVYINGQIDTGELEAHFQEEGLTDRVYFFRCGDQDEPALRRRLTTLFDLSKRRDALDRFGRDLLAYLEAPRLDDLTFARRFFYAGPVHYRVTFVEEPPLPASYLPPGYPMERLQALLPALAARRAAALARYFRTVNV
jgi:DNA-binding transcriptional regulator PaaX